MGATKFLHLQHVSLHTVAWQCTRMRPSPPIAEVFVSPAVPLTSLDGIVHEQVALIHADPVRVTFGSLLAWELEGGSEAQVARVVPEL
jgi:hypothetical protein